MCDCEKHKIAAHAVRKNDICLFRINLSCVTEYICEHVIQNITASGRVKINNEWKSRDKFYESYLETVGRRKSFLGIKYNSYF